MSYLFLDVDFLLLLVVVGSGVDVLSDVDDLYWLKCLMEVVDGLGFVLDFKCV